MGSEVQLFVEAERRLPRALDQWRLRSFLNTSQGVEIAALHLVLVDLAFLSDSQISELFDEEILFAEVHLNRWMCS